jgi:hypothetical protein
MLITTQRLAPTCQTHDRVSSFRFLSLDIVVLSTLRLFPTEAGDSPGSIFKPCLDVYAIPETSIQEPDPFLHADIDPDLDGDSPPCAWDVDDMIYGSPAVMLCLPSLVDHPAGLRHNESPSEEPAIFRPDAFTLSLTHRASRDYVRNPGRLTYHVTGHLEDDAGRTDEYVTCSGSVSIQHILALVANVTVERARLLKRDEPALLASIRETVDTDEKAYTIFKQVAADLWGSTDNSGAQPSCKDPNCGCIRSCRGSCLLAEQDHQPQTGVHFHFKSLNWEKWGEADRLFFHEPHMTSATVGSRIFVLDPDPTDGFQRGFTRTCGIKLHKLNLTVYDINEHIRPSHNPILSRPIGSVPSTSKSSGMTPSTTKIIPCPLTRPIPPPQFVDKVHTWIEQTCDVPYRFPEVFDQDITTFRSRKYRHITRELKIDSSRPVKGVFCDGENIVIAMVSFCA